jgi:hypothetical protein
MDRKRHGQFAYLLRLWREDDGAETVWRASLQDVRTGKRHGFPGLDEAFTYLQQQLHPPPRPGDLVPDLRGLASTSEVGPTPPEDLAPKGGDRHILR